VARHEAFNAGGRRGGPRSITGQGNYTRWDHEDGLGIGPTRFPCAARTRETRRSARFGHSQGVGEGGGPRIVSAIHGKGGGGDWPGVKLAGRAAGFLPELNPPQHWTGLASDAARYVGDPGWNIVIGRRKQSARAGRGGAGGRLDLGRSRPFGDQRNRGRAAAKGLVSQKSKRLDPEQRGLQVEIGGTRAAGRRRFKADTRVVVEEGASSTSAGGKPRSRRQVARFTTNPRETGRSG